MTILFHSIFALTMAFTSVSSAAQDDLLEEWGTGSKSALSTQVPYRFVTWNIYKGEKDGLEEDYAFFIDNYDFVVTQEFLFDDELEDLAETKLNNYWAFAKSFESGDGWTGVATVSKWQAKQSTAVQSPGKEPITNTPKMSLISLFSIDDGRELMIINVHALNFNLSHSAFKKQIDDVISRIQNHVGPMILAGDFNTWADERRTYLLKKTEAIGLTRADLENPMGIMNATLDHIFYRDVVLSTSMVLDDVFTSDHAPMMVEFSL